MVTNNKSPRISVNKLAEFIGSKGARQRQILHDQKYPPDFKAVYYKEASEAVAKALASNLEDLSSISNATAILEQVTSDKIGTQRRITSNLDALETFNLMLDKIDSGGATFSLGEQFPQKLTYYGVDISVRPEVIARTIGKKGSQLVGAVKLHFPRTFCHDEESAGYVSAIVQEWCKVNLYNEGTTHGPLCTVIDVGSQTVYPGVKATTQRMKDVEAECQNIAALWTSI